MHLNMFAPLFKDVLSEFHCGFGVWLTILSLICAFAYKTLLTWNFIHCPFICLIYSHLDQHLLGSLPSWSYFRRSTLGVALYFKHTAPSEHIAWYANHSCACLTLCSSKSGNAIRLYTTRTSSALLNWI